MPIEDLARDDVVSAGAETTVSDLATTMRDERVGSIVITDGATPVGIVTDRDLAMRVLADGDAATDSTAEAVMSEDLVTIERDHGFYEAADLMSDNGVRRLPVCDADGELTGIITADDLSELIADEQQHLADVIRAQRPPY
ncbi:CBS domain-containing protein [Halorussus marinus]|uniref:CBS domain-containing protein n=1 Tax=Halorussus marinus TaxID=2505976 RepID=UPI00106E4956|nr:CBS domain-containing protein [Halorussus marinus]